MSNVLILWRGKLEPEKATTQGELGAGDVLLTPDGRERASAAATFPKGHSLQPLTLTHMGVVKYSLYLPDADTLPFLTMVGPQRMCPALN